MVKYTRLEGFMVGIIFALKSEAMPLLKQLDKLDKVNFLDKEAYLCSIENIDCIIAISGIGKVSASICAQKMIDTYNVDYILNAGSCGGTDNSVKIKSFYSIEKCFQFDFDVTEIDDVEIGYIQEYNRVFFPLNTKGLDFLEKASLATADRFSNAEKDLTLLKSRKCSLRDMEGSAIAQTCISNNVPFYSIKGVTDVYGSGIAKEQFYGNLTSVCEELAEIVKKAIVNISLLTK
jgi:adenosylhomocysteine nucleosidase